MLYIVYVDMLCSRGYIGIKKKLLAQIKTFSKVFGKVFYTTYSGQMIYLMLDGEVVEKEIALTVQECNKCILEWIDKYKITKTYIRYNYASKWFLQFLEEQKKRDIVSVLEFPTIPYDAELLNKRVLVEDRFYRKKMSNYIDKCTTYSVFNDVFGIPCISLVNGVDVDEHPLKKQRKPDGNIVLIAVASMAKWHGYERVINGMAEYYKGNAERKVFFRLVGEGPETEGYKNLVTKNDLEDYVEFCGRLEENELDRQYDASDIGVGAMGSYKKGVMQAGPIKTSEYCVRGIPFIYGYHDTGLRGDEYYAMEVSNSEENININKILKFYDEVVAHEKYTDEMRTYAESKYSWDVILKPVTDYFSHLTD